MEIEEIRDGFGIVDITDKPPVHRTATATGLIKLKESTVEAIRSGRVKKGDVISTARVAAILAVKDAPRLIPFCHQISITAADVIFDVQPDCSQSHSDSDIGWQNRGRDGGIGRGICCPAKRLGHGQVPGERRDGKLSIHRDR